MSKTNNNHYSFNKDNLARVMAITGGIGTSEYDPILDAEINPVPIYSRIDLSNAYRTLWPCKKVCDYLPDAMARGWGNIILPNNKKIEFSLNKEFNRLRRLYCSAQKQANLYGGATIVRFVDDGRGFDQPIAEKIESISYSRVYTPWDLYPRVETGLEDPEYAEYYTFASTDENEIPMTIHRDRVLRFRGGNIDFLSMKANRGYEDSLLIPFLEPCLRYLTAVSYVGASVKNFEFTVHKIQGLFGTIQSMEGQNKVASRIQFLHNAVSSLRGALIDKDEEEVAIVSRRYSGVPEIIEMLLNEMISASGLTKPQFIQEHPSGLAATGESERLAEADKIRSLQQDKWGEQIEKEVELWLKSVGYAKNDWAWEWGNLFQQTPLESADTILKLANAKRAMQVGIKDIDTNEMAEELRKEVESE